MDKLKMQTPNITDNNIEQIAKLFPNVMTETKDEDGKIKKAVDFDRLKQCLSDVLVDDEDERYRLDWLGKKASLLKANTPIKETLRPCREESVNFDTTENVYIEGDNFEVLKILQESYLRKIKMIYIDPPYNTGNDFIYKDDFTASKKEYEEELGVENEEGERLFKNTDSNGRFHSDWLSMMYERLLVARDLLKDDGAIFISIDDNEVHNLRKICDEIFGENNFIAKFIWKRRASSAMADNNVSADQDYVICYQKGLLTGFIGIKKEFQKYSNPDNDPRGSWVLGDLTVGMTAAMRPNQAYDLVDPKTGNVFPFNPNRAWAYIPESMERMVSEGRVIFPNDTSKRPMQKRFQKELKSTHNPFSTLIMDKVGLNTEATKTIQEVMGGNIFDYSKPLSLLTTLIPQICNRSDIVLDFFAGSSVTAHAIMALNAENILKGTEEDITYCKFIMIQLPEPCDENTEAFKAGYKTIAEIGKERIRRAGNKIIEELEKKSKQLILGEEPVDTDILDIGFRVYKTDSTNMKDVYYHPEELQHKQLSFLESNIKEDRTSDDLLTQVILDLGLELNLPIEKKDILGNTVFIVQTSALIACFDDNINFKIVDEIAELKPFKVVFKDASFKDDKDRINVEERFKRLSPETVITVI
jgi:adenine-specific DNA-methyltransferase